jgi:predicted HD phosphohydrolase
MGLNPDKALCVEINDGPGYRKDLHLWGLGGVMVHEFSHAYHHRMLQDGYANQEIYECYKAAMKEKLYACVKVHGPQGPTAKAYACANEMEYWAELSTAFLGGIGPDYADKEYNKWFPFNRQQLKEHDPRAYSLLSKLWKVDCK